jgi:hypothetical protein
MELYFVAMVFGPPIALLLLALLAGLAHRDVTDVLDWKPTRSPKREAELRSSEVSQMLEAQNRYRRLRGEPERTLEEILDAYIAGPTADRRRLRTGLAQPSHVPSREHPQ